MTKEQPETLAETFTWLEENLTEKQINELRALRKDELWQTSFSIDKIVAQRLLKENSELRQHLDKSAFCDDPDLASQVVTAFWDYLQMQDSSGKES